MQILGKIARQVLILQRFYSILQGMIYLVLLDIVLNKIGVGVTKTRFKLTGCKKNNNMSPDSK